jgi:hypothetical protein
VLVKRLDDSLLEVVRAGEGGVELAEQGQGLAAHGLLDEGELAHLPGAERLAEPGGLGVDAAAAACPFQQGAELCEGQLRGVGGRRGGGEEGAGLGPHDAASGRGEGGEEARVVLAQVGAEPVVRGGAVSDRVLLGPGQHRDGLGELAVGGQRPVRVHVGAQDVGEGERVALVGFPAGDRVPVPVAGHCHGVDRVDRPARGAQARDEQAAGRLDRDRDGVLGAVAVLGEQSSSAASPAASSSIRRRASSPPSRFTRAMSWWSSAQSIPQNTSNWLLLAYPASLFVHVLDVRGHARSLMEGLKGTAIRLAVRDPGFPQAPVCDRARRLWSR